MATLTIKIKMDNAAFTDGNGGKMQGPEAARILMEYAKEIRQYDTIPRLGLLVDVNGNAVGEARATR